MSYFYKGGIKYSSHEQIADLINKNKLTSVLDVGCNKGFIGRALKDKLWEGNLTGLDIDSSFKTKLKKPYSNFINQDIEAESLTITRKFDAIVLADVLEHLNNPQKTLVRLKKLLSENGVIIISLPNIANIFVRACLLFGHFDYKNYGIMDKEHRYFYTYKSSKRLIKKAKLSLIYTSQTPIPTFLIHKFFNKEKPFFWIYYIFVILSKIRKEVFSYQFIFMCK